MWSEVKIDQNQVSEDGEDGPKTTNYQSQDIRQNKTEGTYGNSGKLPGYSDYWETAVDEELSAYVEELKGKVI